MRKKWAYDASSYKEYSTVYAPFWDEEKIYHAEYCTTINDVELWTFDDWKNHVDDKEDEIESGKYSALSYVKNVLTDGVTGEPLTDTVTALYRFHKAAKAFFSAPKPGSDETEIRDGN